jgi:hypothetical protein
MRHKLMEKKEEQKVDEVRTRRTVNEGKGI